VSVGGCEKDIGTGISVDDEGVCFCSRAEVGDWLNDESLECEGLIWPSAPLLLSLDDSVKSEDNRFAMMVLLSCYLLFFGVSFTLKSQLWRCSVFIHKVAVRVTQKGVVQVSRVRRN
jgi:hypothetical protein